MDTPTLDAGIAQALIDRHFAIWNHRDPQARLAELAAVYSADFVVADYAGLATGHAQVNQLIDRVQAQHPGFTFTPDPVTWNHGLGRVTWGYGPAENPDAVRGEDIFTVNGQRLVRMHVFIDKRRSP